MVVQEPGHRGCRVGGHVVEARGPDAGRHRQHEVLAERPGEAPAVEPVAGRFPAVGADECLRLLGEADDLADHPSVGRAGQVRRLRDDPQRPRLVLERATVLRDGERHVARLGDDAQRAEQSDQVRVVRLVVDDEAGVDGERARAVVDLDRVRVTAQVRAGLEHGHVVEARERPGRAQARDPTSHDGDPHRWLLRIPRASHPTRRRMTARRGLRTGTLYDGSCRRLAADPASVADEAPVSGP